MCTDGYAPGLGYICNECSKSLTIFYAVITVVIFIVILLAGVYMVRALIFGSGATPERRSSGRMKLSDLRRLIPFQSLKVLIVTWQIIIQVSIRAGMRVAIGVIVVNNFPA